MTHKDEDRYRTWRTWYNMVDRCTNENCKDYGYYGGRGISVCSRWMDFENFLNDMGIALKGKSIDRIDSDGNYEPFNCRWATKVEQNQNRSYNVKGYTFHKGHGKYHVNIKVNGKKSYFGSYDTAEEARQIYLKNKTLLHGKNNIPEIVRRLHSIWEAI